MADYDIYREAYRQVKNNTASEKPKATDNRDVADTPYIRPLMRPAARLGDKIGQAMEDAYPFEDKEYSRARKVLDELISIMTFPSVPYWNAVLNNPTAQYQRDVVSGKEIVY